eukprot:TRINITY_DN8238_c0_g1_i1.p2 TRINITY_DN8238_c0_g1~~TRINITY_DN8238_c0_g1_i1.p2  ORF type:complete len:352 (-),score=128.02 TRINITY_DN8238_c0_g1_i1:118-1173(-)
MEPSEMTMPQLRRELTELGVGVPQTPLRKQQLADMLRGARSQQQQRSPAPAQPDFDEAEAHEVEEDDDAAVNEAAEAIKDVRVSDDACPAAAAAAAVASSPAVAVPAATIAEEDADMPLAEAVAPAKHAEEAPVKSPEKKEEQVQEKQGGQQQKRRSCVRVGMCLVAVAVVALAIVLHAAVASFVADANPARLFLSAPPYEQECPAHVDCTNVTPCGIGMDRVAGVCIPANEPQYRAALSLVPALQQMLAKRRGLHGCGLVEDFHLTVPDFAALLDASASGQSPEVVLEALKDLIMRHPEFQVLVTADAFSSADSLVPWGDCIVARAVAAAESRCSSLLAWTRLLRPAPVS